MIIHDDWLFVSTQKCATNTLYAALPQTGAVRHGGGFHGRPQGRERPLHWTVIRNPYDRAVSIWASTCLRDGDRYKAKAQCQRSGRDPASFPDFAWACLQGASWAGGHRSLFRPQHAWHAGMVLDVFARFEALDDDVAAIIGEVIDMPRENASARGDWLDYYDRETYEIVTRWAGADVGLCEEYLWAQAEIQALVMGAEADQ